MGLCIFCIKEGILGHGTDNCGVEYFYLSRLLHEGITKELCFQTIHAAELQGVKVAERG